jgi:hypothetical protein
MIRAQARCDGNARLNRDDRHLKYEDWFALTRRIYSYIDSWRVAQRVEIFNAEFGMNRALAAGFLALVMILVVKSGVSSWNFALLLSVCAALALYRMHRFSRHYAQALFRNFLNSPETTLKEAAGEGTKALPHCATPIPSRRLHPRQRSNPPSPRRAEARRQVGERAMSVWRWIAMEFHR